jgi:hypothetical protein
MAAVTFSTSSVTVARSMTKSIGLTREAGIPAPSK